MLSWPMTLFDMVCSGECQLVGTKLCAARW